MSIVREKLVKEDIELGHGIVEITDPTDPTGAKLNGNKVGVHTLTQGVYNVMDFGAVGDGIANDTPEIQLAIDTAGANSVILFPPGAYRIIHGPIIITNNNVVLRGLGARWANGNGSLIESDDRNFDILQMTGADNVLIENLGFRHKDVAEAGKYSIRVSGGDEIRIENCCIVSASGTTNCKNGIAILATATKGVSNCVIRGCYIGATDVLAISIAGYDATHLVSGLRVEDSVLLSAGDKGLRLTDYVRETQIDRCTFDSCGLSIDLAPTTNDTSYNIAIRNCILNNSQVSEHIKATKIDRVVVMGNRITTTPATKFGITGDLDCAKWQIVGNYIVDCTAGGVNFDGESTLIAGNYIAWDNGTSVVLGANSQWCCISNNTLMSNLGRITDAGSLHAFGWNLANNVAVMRFPTSAPADGDIQNQEFTIWVNEVTNVLTFKLKYAAGTVKTGTVALV